MYIRIIILKVFVNLMEIDIEWSFCKELFNERNVIIVKGDIKINKKKMDLIKVK